jgi:hypothetical protein
MRVSSNGRVRRSQDEWREIITRFAGSGLGEREFCRQEKINKNSFERWQKRLGATEQSDFVDVTPILQESSSSWAVEVELANGTIVRIGS